MTQQTVYGGRFHGAKIMRARVWHPCDGCFAGIKPRTHYIVWAESIWCGWVNYRYCGHCEASTPEGRAAVAAVTRAREMA
jgi:hypothetical protein